MAKFPRSDRFSECESPPEGAPILVVVATVNWFVIDRGLVLWKRTHGQENTDPGLYLPAGGADIGFYVGDR